MDLLEKIKALETQLMSAGFCVISTKITDDGTWDQQIETLKEILQDRQARVEDLRKENLEAYQQAEQLFKKQLAEYEQLFEEDPGQALYQWPQAYRDMTSTLAHVNRYRRQNGQESISLKCDTHWWKTEMAKPGTRKKVQEHHLKLYLEEVLRTGEVNDSTVAAWSTPNVIVRFQEPPYGIMEVEIYKIKDDLYRLPMVLLHRLHTDRGISLTLLELHEDVEERTLETATVLYGGTYDTFAKAVQAAKNLEE